MSSLMRLSLTTGIIATTICLIGPVSGASAASADNVLLPAGKAPLAVPHLPGRVHAFVWRNWESVDAERMAQVLETTPENVRAIGDSMGLPEQPPAGEMQAERSYISLIRRNWHLLPYEQLLTLLGWDAQQLAYTLREDDFLYVKLGYTKPECPPLKYEPPSEAEAARCAKIRNLVQSHFADAFAVQAEPRFSFVRTLSNPPSERAAEGGLSPDGGRSARRTAGGTPGARQAGDGPRFLYSYFALYGDPLLTPELDPYPDGLLQRLSDCGVNGVWIHSVLRHLAPSERFPEFGEGHTVRLENLRQLVERARRSNIDVYLYLNEPRAMPQGFFEKYPHLKGAEDRGHFAMCTTGTGALHSQDAGATPADRESEALTWVTEALAHVFRTVPDLGGVFTITASENLTNCASRYGQDGCPRCKDRPPADIIAEVNAAIEAGVRKGSPDAKVLVWDWGWKDEWAADIIRQLPASVWLMSVSEWSLPINRGGVASAIGEYSMSAVGPGPRASRHWDLARQRGIRTIAKVQVNNTWELSAVPYLPVMNLVARHAENLTRAGIEGMMLSWTLGGYPSPNLELIDRFFSTSPPPTADQALVELARDRYGRAAAVHALRAWEKFSTAFEEYPYHGTLLYAGPAQCGPANLLFAEPTDYNSTMVGFPYDDVENWRAVYPGEVMATQFEKVAAGWKEGLESLGQALDRAQPPYRWNAVDDLLLAEAAYLHFKSVANQTRFTLARNALAAADLPPDDSRPLLAAMQAAAEDEIRLATRLFTLARLDARIGYEASNHYYYYPLDLVEKVINCRYILDEWLPARR